MCLPTIGGVNGVVIMVFGHCGDGGINENGIAVFTKGNVPDPGAFLGGFGIINDVAFGMGNGQGFYGANLGAVGAIEFAFFIFDVVDRVGGFVAGVAVVEGKVNGGFVVGDGF